MIKSAKNILILIALFIFSIILTYAVVGGVVENIVVNSESLFMPYMTFMSVENDTDYFVKMFLSSDHSWFLVSFVLHLFSRILPVLTNHHPQDFYLEFGCILFFLMFYFHCVILSSNGAKYLKNHYAFLSVFFVIFPFIINDLKSAEFLWVLFNDTWFLCYILNSFFPLLLFSFLEKNYVTTGEIIPPPPVKTKLNIPLIGILILILLTSIGHELYRFVFCGSLILGVILHKILFKDHFKSNKIWYFILFSIVMCSLLFLTPTVHYWYLRLDDDFVPFSSFCLSVSNLFDCVIDENICRFLFIVIFSVISFFVVDDKKMAKRLIISTASVYLSILAFNFLVIFISGNHLEISQHDGITYLTKTVLLYLLFSNIGFLWAYSSEKFKKSVSIFLALFFVFWYSFFLYKRIFNIEKSEVTSEFYKEYQYLVEKAYDVYGKSHNTIYATYPESTVDLKAIRYLKYWYGGNGDKYKIKYICSTQDSFEYCKKKFIKVLYKKSGYLITESEIKKTDFSTINGYNQRKRNGKIFVDFFQ